MTMRQKPGPGPNSQTPSTQSPNPARKETGVLAESLKDIGKLVAKTSEKPSSLLLYVAMAIKCYFGLWLCEVWSMCIMATPGCT